MFDFRSYCDDFGVSTNTYSPNSAPGWIQVQCPFCSDHSDHLGFNLNIGFMNCWRCGGHTVLEYVQRTSRTNWEKAKLIIQNYEADYTPFKKREVKPADSLSIDFAGKLSNGQRKYLESRKFDPDTLIKTWGIKGTGPIGDYKHRIIAPITYNKTLVSFTGRDFTGKAKLRYKSCKREKEVIHHKRILYGLDKAKGHKCIVVEGVTDVWRIGPGAVAVFGINYLPQQMYLIAERFSKVFIMFDEGVQAQEEALKLGTGLSMLGIEAERCLIQGDPWGSPTSGGKQIQKGVVGMTNKEKLRDDPVLVLPFHYFNDYFLKLIPTDRKIANQILEKCILAAYARGVEDTIKRMDETIFDLKIEGEDSSLYYQECVEILRKKDE